MSPRGVQDARDRARLLMVTTLDALPPDVLVHVLACLHTSSDLAAWLCTAKSVQVEGTQDSLLRWYIAEVGGLAPHLGLDALDAEPPPDGPGAVMRKVTSTTRKVTSVAESPERRAESPFHFPPSSGPLVPYSSRGSPEHKIYSCT